MSLSSIYKTVVGISPKIEVFSRKLYWRNITKTSKLQPKFKRTINGKCGRVDFKKIIDNLAYRGVAKGSILIVHSSYDLLENSGLSPEEINSMLLELVGPEGTVVMPIIRKYKGEGNRKDFLIKDLEDIVCTYNVQKTRVVSGILPYTLMQDESSYVSRFPVNPVVAVGKHAAKMVEHNLDGIEPSPHGPNSCWKYCVDNNAIVVGLGVDMPHYLTVIHVNEDCSSDWPIEDWYRKRKFEIIDNDFKVNKVVLERRPIWGLFYFAEIKLEKELTKNKILKTETVEGLKISIIESKRLIEFLRHHPHRGFPYYVRSEHIKSNS